MIGRAIGWASVLLALVMLVRDLLSWWRTGAWRAETLGSLWASVDLASLNLVQAVTQRHVAPWLWEDALLPVLLAPAWLTLAITTV